MDIDICHLYTFTYRDKGYEIINPSYSRCYPLRCESPTAHEYEIIPEMHEMVNNKASPDHCYYDTINIKYDNLSSERTSNVEHKVHNINKSDPTSSADKQTATPVNKAHGDQSTSPPPKLTVKSIHKRLLLRKRYVFN